MFVQPRWRFGPRVGSERPERRCWFQVEMFTYGDNVGWATLARRLHSTHYTQTFLKPGRSYLFLVRAENSHGLSPPSHVSNRVALSADYRQNVPFSPDMSIAKSTLFGGHIVDLIDIKTVSSTSIKVFWEVRKSLIQFYGFWSVGTRGLRRDFANVWVFSVLFCTHSVSLRYGSRYIRNNKKKPMISHFICNVDCNIISLNNILTILSLPLA